MAVATAELDRAPKRGLPPLDDLLLRMRAYLPQADLSVVRQAYEFAARAHAGQVRGTGEPYVQHPLETALALADLQLDRATIAAGLLHDVPEDTAATLDDVRGAFGDEVAGLVETLPECYAALGVVHTLWTQVPGQFDDYISIPKGNMYQSLHTAVIGPGGRFLEVQIRPDAMHRVAEHGLAAHWRYKEGGQADPAFEAKLAWLRQLMAWQQELSTAQEFVESVKMDVFQDQVFVFTPKGEVKDLPAHATPLDFAYRIHTDVGHRCVGARVNQKLVPLDTELKNGDIVEIVTSKSARGPSRDWLKIAQTAHAREKIRQWFKQQQRAQNIARGKEALDKELRRLGLGGLGALPDEKLAEAAEALKMGSTDHLLAALGYGGVGT